MTKATAMSTVGFAKGALALAFALGNVALSDLLRIDVGEIFLQPNVAAQVVELWVYNSASTNVPVQGIELNLQIGDGGLLIGGSTEGPGISVVDLVAGTIFEANNLGTNDASGRPQEEHPLLGFYSTVTRTATVDLPAASRMRLARVTFDTRGLESGRWALAVGATVNGPTRFVNLVSGGQDGSGAINPRIEDGFLQIAQSSGVPRLAIHQDSLGRMVLEPKAQFVGRWRVLSADTLDAEVWTEVPVEILEAGGGFRVLQGISDARARFFRVVIETAP